MNSSETRSRTVRRPLAALAIVAVLASVALALQGCGGPDPTTTEEAADVTHAVDRVTPRVAAGHVASSTSTTVAPIDVATSEEEAPAGPGHPTPPPPPPAPAPGQFRAPTEVWAEPGENGMVFPIGNTGGSPVGWSIAPDDHPTAIATPMGGILAPGAAVDVVIDLGYQNPDGDIPLQFETDLGLQVVMLHFEALEPVLEVVDGTWNIRNGNTFLPAYGDMDLGLKLHNAGDQPLHVSPVHAGGLTLVGGPWDLQPGETVHLQVLLCNAAFDPLSMFHDRDLHIDTDGWQGTVDFGVRFTLQPAQVAPAC